MSNSLRFHSFAAIFILLAAAAVDASAEKIVYQSERDGNYELYVLELTTGEATPLTSQELPGSKWEPRWSPDGTRVVFTRTTKGGLTPTGDSEWFVYVINADGTGLTAIADAGKESYEPRWSPDGSRVVFSSNRAGQNHIFSVKPDGSDVQQLSDGQFFDYQPQWSPDGSKIVYLSVTPSFSQIHIMDADGGNNVAITSDDSYHEYATFSPDGTQILFRGTAGANFAFNDIFVINADGSNLRNLTNDPDTRVDVPVWSPDGTRIAFRYGSPGQIYVMNADGSDLHAAATSPGVGHELPQWSPDGLKIVFGRFFGTDYEVFMVSPNGSDLERLTMHPGNDRAPEPFGNFGPLGPPAIFDGGVILSTLAPKVETISPLSIISVFGENFTKRTVLFPTLNTNGDLDRILSDACLEMNGERLPIFAVTPGQINAQASEKKMLGPATFQVITDCDTPSALVSEPFRFSGAITTRQQATSDAEMATVEEATPGFFLYSPVSDSGFIAARFNSDNAAVAPEGMFHDQFGPSRPAQPGDIIVLYGTGWGETTAGLSAGQLAPTAAWPLLPTAGAQVTFGGIAVDAIYVGATPQTAGLYQLAIAVPANAQPGNNQVVLTVYGKSTPVGPVIPVAAP